MASFVTIYPYINIGLKVADCVTKSVSNAADAKVELSFWDYLKIIGSCLLKYSGDLQDAEKLNTLKKREDFTIK